MRVAGRSACWPTVVPAAPTAAPVATAPPPPGPAPSVGNGINFPSAASIPPVSIMTDEPSQPPSQTGPGPAPAAGPQKRPPAPARPAARAQTAPAAPAAPPIQIGPLPAAN